MSTSRTEITLHAMRFHARVGVLPHEREHAQPVEIDLTVRLRAPSAGEGAQAVVDYRDLYDVAAGALAGGHVDYLEELAETVAAGALARPRVASARVAVRKPHVALAGPLGFAEVVVERSAGSDE
ncbi:MAG TPA: dihydroneopterin aldolase [Gemmatimonadaceae bacterium]|nr:dihydroneopterin aldolase [Gemmatimonadaceae bacterium]